MYIAQAHYSKSNVTLVNILIFSLISDSSFTWTECELNFFDKHNKTHCDTMTYPFSVERGMCNGH